MSDLEVWKGEQPKWVSLLEPAAELARMVGQTEFVPSGLRNRNAAIAACVLYGAELGIGPMQALAKIRLIEGTPAPSAELMRGLALAAGHDIWIEEVSSTKATVAGQRANSEHVQRITWTIDDARRAKLDSRQNWRNYPRQMLVARASAELVRLVAPDVLGGIAMSAEEMEDAEPRPAETPAPKRTRRSLAAVPAPEEPEPADQPRNGVLSDPEPESGSEGPETAEGNVEVVEGAATEQQRKLMFALFRDVEATAPTVRRAIVAEVLGEEVSSKDMTGTQMSLVIDDLQRRKAEGWVAF